MIPSSPGLVMDASPISDYLASQQRLDTPVVRFAEAYEAKQCGVTEGARTQLIPLSRPGPGEQFAFEVDMDQCTGCKACVAACHSLNGLDEEETWRDVGAIIGGTDAAPYQQTITSACHHCEDPGCLNGCPVLAYEKDPQTGIVRHLDDQCIGCQYCVLKCPYDVPKYSKRLGIVRKCDMCHSRLSVGEAPACAQACPTEAIRISIVATQPAVAASANRDFLSPFPDPEHTKPTTRYVSQRPVPANIQAADAHVARPQHAHWPLVWMLPLTQAAAGMYLVGAFGPASLLADGLAFALFSFGIAASVAHLGRPAGAWRAFMGLRRSWMSREIVIFGGVFPAGTALLAAHFVTLPGIVASTLPAIVALVASSGVFSSVMIYHDTRRRFWRFPMTAYQFFGTTLSLGALLAGLANASSALIAAGGILALAKIALNRWQYERASRSNDPADRQSARLLATTLRPWSRTRLILGGFGSALALAAAAFSFTAPGIAAALVLFAGELAERALFFKAVNTSKMPGGLTR